MQELRDLVRRFLVLNPNQRLGALKGGAADVKMHPWFANFNWDAFSKRQLKAPYVPQVVLPLNTPHPLCAWQTGQTPGDGIMMPQCKESAQVQCRLAA